MEEERLAVDLESHFLAPWPLGGALRLDFSSAFLSAGCFWLMERMIPESLADCVGVVFPMVSVLRSVLMVEAMFCLATSLNLSSSYLATSFPRMASISATIFCVSASLRDILIFPARFPALAFLPAATVSHMCLLSTFPALMRLLSSLR